MDTETLETVIERLTSLPEMLRQTLTDHLWGRIPIHVSEHTQGAILLNSGGVYNIVPQVSGLVLIESVTAVIGANGGAILQLGGGNDHSIPLAAGVTNLTDLKIILGPGDIRRITANAGNGVQYYVLLSGEQMPTTGTLAP